MLLHEDPDVHRRMDEVVVGALRRAQYDTAAAALYLMLYWLGENAPAVLDEFLRQHPEAKALPMVSEMRAALREHGYLTLF
jgi:hypothetical protein